MEKLSEQYEAEIEEIHEEYESKMGEKYQEAIDEINSQVLEEKNQIAEALEEMYPSDESWTSDLTEEDEAFLWEHVYGEWKIAYRVKPVNAVIDMESDKPYTNRNFSADGQKTLSNMSILISNYYVTFRSKTQYFDDPNDAYLFGIYGGYAEISDPVYHIKKANATKIKLFNIYNIQNEYVSCDGLGELYNVYYNFGYDPYAYPSYTGNLPNNFYVDMDDPDVLYMDFCGLWKLYRIS